MLKSVWRATNGVNRASESRWILKIKGDCGLQDRYGIKGTIWETRFAVRIGGRIALLKRKTQSDATLAKRREIELASPGNAALQEQERKILTENEQERQPNRPLALTPYSQRVTKT